MIAICVDDEPILLNWLLKIVSASSDIKQAEAFSNELDALCFAKQHPFDIAFLDIELHNMNGLSLAESLRAINPECGIVFCTGHANYAVDAIGRLNVDGYLLKPIDSAAVQKELDRFKLRYQKTVPLLVVDFSSGINIFDKNDKPLHFQRKKTEQLLTILIKQNGESISTRQLCELLWTDSINSQYLYEKNENYLSQLFTDLRHTLEKCEAQDILKKTATGYALYMPLIKKL